MARTAEEIAEQIARNINSTDPSVDTDKGPVYDFLIAPVAPITADSEAENDRLAKLFTHQFGEVITDDEAESLSTSFGVLRAEGDASTGRVTFYTFTAPDDDIEIPRGTLIGTSEGTLIYYVTDEDLTMLAANASAYYNASTRRYEIVANVEAVAVGEDYDVPATKISSMISSIDGLDSVTNTTRTEGGLVQESNEELADRIQAKFQGIDPDTGGGIVNAILEFAPTKADDIVLVYSSDRSGVFVRKTNRPAVDVYVLGTDNFQTEMSYTATGGETYVILEHGPTYTVDRVTVNGAETAAYSFVLDSDPNTKGTSTEQSKVVFDTALIALDEVEITYTYNKLIEDLQNEVFSPDEERPFDTSILTREFNQQLIITHVVITVLSSFNSTRVQQDVENVIYTYVEPDKWVEFREPETLQKTIRENVSGVGSVTVKKFTLAATGVLDVETLEFTKAEIPKIDTNNFTIEIR